MNNTIRIFIVDDHEIVLDGLKAILNPFNPARLENADESAPFQIVGVATDGTELLERIGHIRGVDVVVMDYLMKTMNGIEAALALKAAHPGIRVVLFSMYDTDVLIREAFAANIDGYVTKGEGRQRLLECIKKVHQGERVFPLLKHQPPGGMISVQTTERDILSKREKQVACLIAEGFTSQKIADTLNIAFNTVEVHRANIYKKLSINKLTDLVKYTIEHNLCKNK